MTIIMCILIIGGSTATIPKAEPMAQTEVPQATSPTKAIRYKLHLFLHPSYSTLYNYNCTVVQFKFDSNVMLSMGMRLH